MPQTLLWYAGSAVAVVEAANVFLPTLGAPPGAMRLLVVIAIFGLPIAITLSWVYDVTTQAGRAWSRTATVGLVSVLSLSGAFVVWNRKAPLSRSDAPAFTEDAAHVAVLRFETLVPDAELEAFAANLQTRLIDGLSAASTGVTADSKRLRIVSRASILPFSRAEVPLDSIRRALKVGTVLEGSVERVPEGLRVRVRLVDASTGDQLAVSEATTSDRLTMVNTALDSVANLIRTSLGTSMRNRMRLLETRNAAAFDRFTLGTQTADQFDNAYNERNLAAAQQTLADADSLFAQAEHYDPDWIEPIVERGHLSERYVRLQAALGSDDLATPLRVGIRHAERALKIKSDDYRALELRGELRALLFSSVASRDSSAATTLLRDGERDLQKSLIGNPTPARAFRVLSELAGKSGQLEKAAQYGKRAYEADPYLEQVSITVFRLFEYNFALNKDAEAAKWCSEGRNRFDDAVFADCRLSLGAWSDAYPLRPDSAWRLVRSELSKYPGPLQALIEPRLDILVAAVLIRNRMRDSARAVITRARIHDKSPGVLRASAGAFEMLGLKDSADAVIRQLYRVPANKRGDLRRAPELRTVRARRPI